MVLNSSSSKRPMGGQPKSEASSWSSPDVRALWEEPTNRKSTRLNSSHGYISYAVFCLKKKNKQLLNDDLLAYDVELARHARQYLHRPLVNVLLVLMLN